MVRPTPAAADRRLMARRAVVDAGEDDGRQAIDRWREAVARDLHHVEARVGLGSALGALRDLDRARFERGEATLPLRFLTVRYEDLVHDPAGTVGRAAAFLGVSPPESAPTFLHTRSVGRSRPYAAQIEVTCPR